MDIKQTFVTAEELLKALAEQRAELAEVVAKPMPAPDDLAARLASVEMLLKNAKAALDPVAAQEEALKGLERALIIANHDADLAARDKRLRTFASERLRIETLIDELTQLRQRLQRQIEVEEKRPGLLALLDDYNERVAQLDGFAETAERFEKMVALAQQARGDHFFLLKRHKEFPEIGEIDLPYNSLLLEPEREARRIAKLYTDLVEPKKTGGFY